MQLPPVDKPAHCMTLTTPLQEAIAAWPAMMGSGLRLGSPAVSVAVDGTTSSSWIGQFMQQVRGLLNAHIAYTYVWWALIL